MALVLADRVKETTTTTSTGTITLAGTSTGYQSFSVIGNGNTTYYTIAHQTANEWEVGIGTYTSSGTTLARTTVLASSNSGSLVNFSAGTKDVFVTYPAERSVNLSSAALTSGRVPYATTSGLLVDSANLTFDGTTLTANTIGAFTLSGTIAGGGNQLNNIVIGTSTPLAGSFTTVSASTSVTTPSVTNAGTLALSATGANIVTASTNGSERMRIDSSGNVGIGQSSQVWDEKLGVRLATSGAGTVGLGVYSASTGYTSSCIRVQTETGGSGWKMYEGRANGGSTLFWVDGSGGAYFAGNVGIGTSSPAASLSVVKQTTALSGTGNSYGLYMYPTSSGLSYIDAITGTTGNTSLGLRTYNNGTYNEVRIDSSGNVGIGGSPFSYGGGYTDLWVQASTSPVIDLAVSTTRTGTFYASSSAVTFGSVASVPLITYTANTERMRIDSSGNVLVGGTAARGTTVGAAHLDLFNGTAPAGTLTNGISLYSSSGDFNFMDSSGNGYKVGFRNVPAVGTKTGSYTLATGDVGKYVQVGSGGSITIPTSTFAEGDVVSLMNNTTAGITITCSAPTSYIAGTDSAKTSMTLATRGVATVFFISSTVCVVTGNVS